MKIFSTWESAQSTLAKKREAKNKATAQGRADRVAQCEEDIKFVSQPTLLLSLGTTYFGLGIQQNPFSTVILIDSIDC